MRTVVHPDKPTAGAAAAADGAAVIRAALRDRDKANIVLATGASQFEMLEALAEAREIDWHAVTGFHLDEFIGLPITHQASFRLYLWQRFVSRLPVPLAAFHYIDAERDPARECARLASIIREHPIDVAFVGIGENGHLAFNDPPADFETSEPYLLVNLDEACRRQQLGEGWYGALDDVPRRAISMSVRRIMSARTIVCTVPERRKAEPLRAAVEGPVTPRVPASILQRHSDVRLYLDAASASLLKKRGEVA
jgi:glucosamine-6-phosphate deaminase